MNAQVDGGIFELEFLAAFLDLDLRADAHEVAHLCCGEQVEALRLESGRLATVEYRLRTHLGEERDFEVRIAPASEDEVVAIVRDVTDLHDATRELKQSRARTFDQL